MKKQKEAYRIRILTRDLCKNFIEMLSFSLFVTLLSSLLIEAIWISLEFYKKDIEFVGARFYVGPAYYFFNFKSTVIQYVYNKTYLNPRRKNNGVIRRVCMSVCSTVLNESP